MSRIKTCFVLLILCCLMVLNWMSFLISPFIQRRHWHLPLPQRCSPIEPFSFLFFPYFDFSQDKRCRLIQINVDEKMCLSSRIYRIKKNQHSLSKGPMYLPLFSPLLTPQPWWCRSVFPTAPRLPPPWRRAEGLAATHHHTAAAACPAPQPGLRAPRTESVGVILPLVTILNFIRCSWLF